MLLKSVANSFFYLRRSVAFNWLSSTPEMSNYTSLVYLDLQGNQLTALPQTIWTLPALNTILASSNNLTAIPTFPASTALQVL